METHAAINRVPPSGDRLAFLSVSPDRQRASRTWTVARDARRGDIYISTKGMKFIRASLHADGNWAFKIRLEGLADPAEQREWQIEPEEYAPGLRRVFQIRMHPAARIERAVAVPGCYELVADSDEKPVVVDVWLAEHETAERAVNKVAHGPSFAVLPVRDERRVVLTACHLAIDYQPLRMPADLRVDLMSRIEASEDVLAMMDTGDNPDGSIWVGEMRVGRGDSTDR